MILIIYNNIKTQKFKIVPVKNILVTKKVTKRTKKNTQPSVNQHISKLNQLLTNFKYVILLPILLFK